MRPRPRPRRSSRSGRPGGKSGVTGVKEARSGLKRLGRNIMSQATFWQTVANMLERRYQTKWFKRGALETYGGGPEERPWPGLTSEPYIKQKRRLGKNQKMVYDGNLKLSYFAQVGAAQNKVWTGVRDPDKDKLRGLTGLGFKLMMVEKTTMQNVYKLLRENTVKGVRMRRGRQSGRRSL